MASIQAPDGSTAHVIDSAVSATSAAISASVTAPHSRRVWPPTTIAAATSPPAAASIAELDLGQRAELQPASALQRDGGEHGAEGHRRQRLGRHARQRQAPRERAGISRSGV